jgi:hypothetical protein
MKSKFSLLQLAALGLLFLKGTETPFFGAVPSWVTVVLPLIIDAVIDLIQQLNGVYGWTDKLKLSLWKFRLKQVVKKRTAEAIAEMKK